MSIVTGRGDDGDTDLMYGARVSKAGLQVEAYGTLDELNACLGLARATCQAAALLEILPWVQSELVAVMGELATAPKDLDRYVKDGFRRCGPGEVETITAKAKALEADLQRKEKGWAVPGEKAVLGAAHLDLARTVCRRAERVLAHFEADDFSKLPSKSVRIWVNRLSDLLWIAARAEERESDNR